MKPYLLFAGFNHHPYGGWGDYIGGADTMEEALKLLPQATKWHHVVHNAEIVEEKSL